MYNEALILLSSLLTLFDAWTLAVSHQDLDYFSDTRCSKFLATKLLLKGTSKRLFI